MLERQGDIKVILEAGCASEALEQYWENDIDVVLLDIHLGDGRNGLDVLQQIIKHNPRQAVLVMTVQNEEQYFTRVMKLGASGFLKKEALTETLVDAVRTTATGRRYVDEEQAQLLVRAIRGRHDSEPRPPLSPRELDVVTRYGRGRTTSEIASEMNLSVNTISAHRRRALDKLGLKTTAELIKYAIDRGLS